MTAHLLPHKDLIALLCRYCYGETADELAMAYEISSDQVCRLLDKHNGIRKNMRAFLGIPRHLPRNSIQRPKIIAGIWRKCNRCQEEFWTESLFIRTCHRCKSSKDWKSGGSDFTTSGVRGLE